MDAMIDQLSQNALHARFMKEKLAFQATKGKSHKLPFSSSSTEYVELFELVVSDLWGPASFQKMIATQFEKQIKKFQSDWGEEFRAFTSVLVDQGILHHLSYPHTSEQNGVAERKHRYIVETGLTLLAQANLPMKHWGYASSSAVHLINKLPTFVLQEEKVIVSRYVVFVERRFLFSPPVSTNSGPSMQFVTYVPIIYTSSSTPPNPPVSSPQLPVVSSPSPVPDSACEVIRSDSDSPSATCSLPATVDIPSGATDMGNERDNCSSTPVSSKHFISLQMPCLSQVPCVSSRNTHAMVTRSKAGIFKPKKVAVQAEFDALMANLTWDLVPSPLERRRNPDGSVSRRKARSVANGCSQILGCDFTETFSPVVKPTTIRVILSIAILRRWSLHQVDVNNAFLNGDLENEKALYGLRQAPRAWFDKLKQFLVSIGFVVSKSDASLFIRITSDSVLYILVIEVTRLSSGCLHLCQKKYIRDLLARSSLSNEKLVHTPMISSSQLSKSDGDLLSDPTEYRSLAGALQYVVLTRPDIAYAVNHIFFRPSTRLSLVGYADVNWRLDVDDRRSTSGYCVYFGYSPVSWCSRKQQVVSRSTVEAEYRSLTTATSDVTWLLSQFRELQVSSVDTPTIWCDSSSAIAVAANPVLHSKFKHVELDFFFVREKVAIGTIVVGKVPACDEVADILTKPLSLTCFTRFRQFLIIFPVVKMDAC
ncbi:hypothetical protein CXB51_035946 [Gossypium anomalum]|uniref:Integrase catalytic domain-containing protein n=1 Tax=Gossypium anomalum TaxID=47600 RepID=A0A8J5XZ39_9ROSI|nr:hypothetical protein CXB51_035946 [Gossypium anomalum]